MTKSESGIVTLGMRECSQCHGTLRHNEYVRCAACNGLGKKDPNKPKGRNCPVCCKHGTFTKGRVISIGTAVCECTKTDHPGRQPETICDSVPDEWIDAMPVLVYRSERPQGISENLFGSGLYSVDDYGRWKNETDEQLIANFRAHRHTQATKVVRQSDMKLCDSIGLFCNRSGYSVMPVWDGDAEAQERLLRRQLDYNTGMAVGMKLANEGLNGTMLVANYLKPE